MRRKNRRTINPKYIFLALSFLCMGLMVLSYVADESVSSVRELTVNIVSPFQKGLNSIGLWVDSKAKNLDTINNLSKKNEELEAELAKNREMLALYESQLSEYNKLLELYSLDNMYPEHKKTAAHVFSKDSSSWFSTFYVDKGLEDGIYEGANVMCDEGLAGIITDCHKTYSKVRAIINDDSSISATILPSNALCTVEGSVNNYNQGTISVNDINKDANVSIGDKVVTSQISDRYHAGITIGYVTSLTNDTNNLTMTATIQPAVNFDDISSVLIITDPINNLENKE